MARQKKKGRLSKRKATSRFFTPVICGFPLGKAKKVVVVLACKQAPQQGILINTKNVFLK